MDILQNLTNLLGASNSRSQSARPQPAQQTGLGGLGELLNPAVLGSLASALFPAGKTGGITGQQHNATTEGGMGGGLGGLLGSLLSGGALANLGGLFGSDGGTGQTAPAQPHYSAPAQADPHGQAARLLRALVYAAKADGHIDEQEQASLNDQIRKLDLGPEARDLVRQYMNETLDPERVARGVTDPGEAAQLYALSCALTGMDNFMEKSYLEGLAQALHLPSSAKSAIENQVIGNGAIA